MVTDKDTQSAENKLDYNAPVNGAAGKVGRDQNININIYGQPQPDKPKEPPSDNKTCGRIVFAIDGSLDDTNINRAKLKLIEARLRELSGDASIQIIAVEEGSIKIILEVSEDRLQQIQYLFQDKEKARINDFPVQYVRTLNKQEKYRLEEKLYLVKQLRNRNIYFWTVKKTQFVAIDLIGMNCNNMNLKWINFIGADLQYANFISSDFTKADLRWSNLVGADLTKANLTQANLLGSDLRRINLTGANLTGSDFRWADLTSANLTGSNLTKT